MLGFISDAKKISPRLRIGRYFVPFLCLKELSHEYFELF